MTPHEFVEKWSRAETRERQASQEHFIDLCRLLDERTPNEADPKGEWYAFEKGVSILGGGDGWADVWKRYCFAWEYKGKRANLEKALVQLKRYHSALQHPPLLIVSDMEVIEIHTSWTNLVETTEVFTFDDLIDGVRRSRLKKIFSEAGVNAFRPGRTRSELTAEVASDFVKIAQSLRDRGHDAEQVAHFVNRMVFCMFAEDVDLLPEKLFTKLLRVSEASPQNFVSNASRLFEQMRSGGDFDLSRIEWFNGGLFDDDTALPLEREDLRIALRAAEQDWSDIDPSIMGTLFERGLDPGKRSQLGAHYTDSDKIMMIVQPVVVEPLEREWKKAYDVIAVEIAKSKSAKSAGARTQAFNRAVALKTNFLERLRAYRILDPACGSGNFLYLGLKALKDIEHRVNTECEMLGMPRTFPAVGPENMLGIEINSFAAELARVAVWIGEIQWMRKHGYDASRNPILKPLNTIECRDAILTDKGVCADWPDADVVVGNPPFLGGKRLRDELSDSYVDRLFVAWEGMVRREADLVLYWFAKAGEMIREGRIRRFGLVSTNSIRGGANRETLRTAIGEGRIFDAWDDEPWVVEGAAVRVSLVCIDGACEGAVRFDGLPADEIYANLTVRLAGSNAVDLTHAVRLPENRGIAFQGFKFGGPFEISQQEAETLLLAVGNPNGRPNRDVVRLWFNGTDIVQRPTRRWCIDLSGLEQEHEAALYEGPFELAHRQWEAENAMRAAQGERPLRDGEPRLAALWWRHQRPRPEMKDAIDHLDLFIATTEVSKHRVFTKFSRGTAGSGSVYIFARADDTVFGILHSRYHELWSLRMGTSLEDRPRYTSSTTFETFPFPEGLTPDIPAAEYASDPRAQAISVAAARLNELRENWLNPPDLVRREPEVVPGYPERILPIDDAAAEALKKRTLTNLYNERPIWLEHAHRELDRAVAAAYGWSEDGLDDDEILGRLFALNQERAAQQEQA